ncbi:MAG: hypothetical protein ACI8UP_003911 [Porticoccaceae bacterium]|jgi:hypothetical protein
MGRATVMAQPWVTFAQCIGGELQAVRVDKIRNAGEKRVCGDGGGEKYYPLQIASSCDSSNGLIK